MGFLKRSHLLDQYTKRQTYLLNEEGEKRYSGNKIHEDALAFSLNERYDIFLSHSYDDARVIRHIRDLLIENGYKVYVDWIEDAQLSRASVSEKTAMILRERMKNSSSLIYASSTAAETSVWMPWELGYMDATTGRVAVAPILNDNEEFEGREYLAMYPYLDITNDKFYIHSAANSWVTFSDWLSGKNPIKTM